MVELEGLGEITNNHLAFAPIEALTEEMFDDSGIILAEYSVASGILNEEAVAKALSSITVMQ